jgi:hypothetical protein
LGVVGLVDWAALADVLNNHQSGLALADLVNKHLIGPTGVDSLTPLSDGIVAVAGRALAAESVDSVVPIDAIAVEGVEVEYFIFIATVAVIIWAGGDLRGGLAPVAILRMGSYGE